MKKTVFLLLITLLLLTGCEKKNEEIITQESYPHITKLDREKDYVYYETLQPITCDLCNGYDLQYAYINLNSDAVLNINLEIKNFVNSSYRNMLLEGDTLVQGRVFHYDSFITDKYISLIQDYFYYFNSTKGDSNSRIYVVNKDTGKLLSNKDILKVKEMSEEDVFSFIEHQEELEDPLFVLSVLKNEGYQLYFNQDMELVLRFYERDNVSVTKREFVLK